MRFGSVCSGIEAASAAWHSLDWRAQWFSEIGEFPSAVLAYHYSDVPNLGDMTRLHEKEVYARSVIDVLIGGTPCQSFSLAGFRKGLADPRGNLALVFLELLKQSIPDGLSGRMFPVCCQALTDETSVPFSVVWRNSGMGSATECWTQDISESHNHGVECTLSAILETGGQLLRYSLSPIACAGTLHRNSVTPLKLKNALEAVSRSVSCGSQDSEVLALEKTSAEL